MDLIKLSKEVDFENIALLFRCLLDRIPILIIGDDEYDVNEFINDLVSYIPFRNVLVYYTDFVENEDYEEILMNEEYDYEIKRSVFLCHCSASKLAVEKIEKLNSWLIGVHSVSEENVSHVKEGLYEKVPHFLLVILDENGASINIEGKEFPQFDLVFENALYKKAIQETEDSIERMKRVLAKKIKLKSISEEQLRELIDFSSEESELKQNMFKKEILAFYQAARRASYILNRMLLIQQMNMPANIAEKTLLNTISYEMAPSSRIVEFIEKEWSQSFQSFLTHGRSFNFGDLLESMWG